MTIMGRDMPTATNISFFSALDSIDERLMRRGEIEHFKTLVKWIYVAEDDEVDGLRRNQIAIQEDLTQLWYVVSTRTQYIESIYAPINKNIEEQMMSSVKKLTAEQREIFKNADDGCAEYIQLIEQGKILVKMIENQINVMKNRHQLIMERSYESRKMDTATNF